MTQLRVSTVSIDLGDNVQAEGRLIDYTHAAPGGAVYVEDTEHYSGNVWIYGDAAALHRLAQACLDAAELVEAEEARTA